MLKSFQKPYPLYFLVDLFFITVTFYLAYFLRYNSVDMLRSGKIITPHITGYSVIFLLLAVSLTILLKRDNLYSTDRGMSIPKETILVVKNVAYSTVIVSGIIFFAQYKFFSRKVLLITSLSLCIILTSWRVLKRLILRKLVAEGYHNINVLIVGAEKMGQMVVEEIKKYPWWGIRLVGFLDDKVRGEINGIPVLGTLDSFPIVAKRYFVEEVIVTTPQPGILTSKILKYIKKMHLGLRIVPEDIGEPLSVPDVTYLGIIPLLTYKERIHHPAELFLKRIFDFVTALLGIIIISPFLILIAVLVKTTSRGPVFYVQKRAGLKGKPFNLYKFRSMVVDADALKETLLDKNEVKDGVIFKMRNDPRVTKIGKFLRRYSLDELPQLFNVIKGDMSLVGPRPPTLDEVKSYNHHQMERLSIRPGITGLSQIKGRSNLTFRKWVKWDLWYVHNWSFGLDLYILWKTIPAVVKGKGAY